MPPPSILILQHGVGDAIQQRSAPSLAAEEGPCKGKGTGVFSQPSQGTGKLEWTLMDPQEGREQRIEHRIGAEVTEHFHPERDTTVGEILLHLQPQVGSNFTK